MFRSIALALALIFSGQAAAQDAQSPSAQAEPQTPRRPRLDVPTYQPTPPQILEARLIRSYEAPEARQGAAVDRDHVYAIVNNVIGKYDKDSGALVARWMSPRGGLIRHINSCFAEPRRLYCANSNFPENPMASSIEVFDTTTMRHLESHALGLLDEGSLTFFDRLGDNWIAGFAHYDGDIGNGIKGAAYAGIGVYDPQWRRVGGWMLPASVRERMAPHAASGGALGPDGYLYVLGHDLPEMYVLAKPVMGPVLLHIATINIDAPGQAFAWDRTVSGRIVYAISRPAGEVRAFELPQVTPTDPDARTFVAPRRR